MSGRSSPTEMRIGAAQALARSLDGAGLGVRTSEHLAVELPDGQSVDLAIEPRAIVDEAVALMLARRVQRPAVVVADAISTEARGVLDQAGIGWLDRRGHIRIIAPGVFIDRDVPSLPRQSASTSEPMAIRGAASIGVAAAHLIGDAVGVRALARALHLSPAAISTARSALDRAGLLDSGVDARRALFWLLVAAWRPMWSEVAALPRAGGKLIVSGTRAAASLGAPLIVTADYPLELYAPDRTAVERALLLTPRSPATRRRAGARFAAAPTPLVFAARSGPAKRVRDWPTAHPLFVALDLAGDPARGQEALEAWDPPGWRRAW